MDFSPQSKTCGEPIRIIANLKLFDLLKGRLLVLRAHLGLQPVEAIGFPIDEFAHLSERRVDFLNPVPHLLANQNFNTVSGERHHPNFFNSASAFSNHNPISISRIIVIAVVRCSLACS